MFFRLFSDSKYVLKLIALLLFILYICIIIF